MKNIDKSRNERKLGKLLFNGEISHDEMIIAAKDQGLDLDMILYYTGLYYEKEQRQGAGEYN